MQLGAFSVSLAVKDIKKSREFYEKLGFEKFHGDEEQNWIMMRNGNTVLGLFQGMFEENVLTFNPGWDQQANELESYPDIREILKHLKDNGVKIKDESVESESGPANFSLLDPDGNGILVDQHV